MGGIHLLQRLKIVQDGGELPGIQRHFFIGEGEAGEFCDGPYIIMGEGRWSHRDNHTFGDGPPPDRALTDGTGGESGDAAACAAESLSL